MGDIIDRLKGDAALVALLHSADSVWHRRAPASDGLPRVVVYRPNEAGLSDLTGPSTLRTPRVQIDALAATAAEASAVAEAVKARMDGFRGTLGDKWCSGFTLEDMRDSDFPVTAGSEARRYMTSSDYAVGWR
jgi:hypothetical protein